MIKRTFEVLNVEYYGKDWSEASMIEARDPEEAAEEYVEKSDSDNWSDSILENGGTGPVLVREKGSDEIYEFSVSAWTSNTYSATRILK